MSEETRSEWRLWFWLFGKAGAKRRGSELAETRTLQARLTQHLLGDPQP